MRWVVLVSRGRLWFRGVMAAGGLGVSRQFSCSPSGAGRCYAVGCCDWRDVVRRFFSLVNELHDGLTATLGARVRRSAAAGGGCVVAGRHHEREIVDGDFLLRLQQCRPTPLHFDQH